MSNILEQMLKESKRQLELEFEHKKELAQIKSCQNNEIKELKAKHKKQIAYLEAKLAEKDAKIDKLETQSLIDIDHISYYQSQYLEIKDKLDQDKISFAVEQLEKVKLYNRQRAFNYMPLTNFIDNQIEELKKGDGGV